MTKEMARQIAERIGTKVVMERIYKDQFKDNERMNPFHSERVGMLQMLKMMDVDFEFEFDDQYEISAVIVMGERVEVK